MRWMLIPCQGGSVTRLAFFTFGILHEPWDYPRIKGFLDRIPDAFASAEGTAGFLWRETGDPPDLGPRFYRPEEHPGAPQTLSLWTELESPYAFAYHSHHAEALRHRKEWFVKPEWPTYVAWWVPDDHIPTWQEAHERLTALHDNGPSQSAFSFKTPFGPDGQATQLNRERVNQLVRTVR
jgi:hypothetical protein